MTDILFIGNSYTYFNDMPVLFEGLSNENGHPCKVTSLTKGGRKLFHNIETDDEFATLVKTNAINNNYSVVFLQDQSLITLDAPEDFSRGIASHISHFNADRFILYATWGRKEGSDKLTERSLTSFEMTDIIASAYADAAKNNGADVSNVGLAFRYVAENYPDIELYNPDLSHPSYEGSCLAAIIHYCTLFDEIPTALSSLKLIPEIEEAFLDAAHELMEI